MRPLSIRTDGAIRRLEVTQNHLSALGRATLNRADLSVFAESMMGSIAMIILKIRDENPFEVVGVQHDRVIQTVSAGLSQLAARRKDCAMDSDVP